jgi:hypothetical protein
MPLAGEAGALWSRKERGLDASQFATTRGNRPQQHRQDQERDKPEEKTTLREIAKDLRAIEKGLQEEGFKSSWLNTLSVLLVRVAHASRDEAEQPLGKIEARLTSIEKILTSKPPSVRAPAGTGTWADLAAGRTDTASGTHAMPTRHTVRVTLAGAQGLSNQEILKEVKKTITGAAAIRVLGSGDIDVAVPDEATRDRAQGLPSAEGLKIHRKDYLVEVTGVPLSTKVAVGPHADNSLLATAICRESQSLAPGLQVTRIKWLHDASKAKRNLDAGKTRGSLIIGFPTQEMQRRAIQGGLVVQAQLFEVRQFETALQEAQCFQCQQWGHT